MARLRPREPHDASLAIFAKLDEYPPVFDTSDGDSGTHYDSQLATLTE
jgi:hypothetical protein